MSKVLFLPQLHFVCLISWFLKKLWTTFLYLASQEHWHQRATLLARGEATRCSQYFEFATVRVYTVGWVTGRDPGPCKSASYPQRFCSGTSEGRTPRDPGSPGKQLLKWSWWRWCFVVRNSYLDSGLVWMPGSKFEI